MSDLKVVGKIIPKDGKGVEKDIPPMYETEELLENLLSAACDAAICAYDEEQRVCSDCIFGEVTDQFREHVIKLLS